MKGSCLCGNIRYQVTTFKTDIANCFCNMCQKSSGAAFATYAHVALNDFKWLQGAEDIGHYQSSDNAHRGFCKNCGSSLYFKLKDNGAGYEITLGTLDEEPNMQPNANIYCSSQAEWSKNNNDLVSYPNGRSKS